MRKILAFAVFFLAAAGCRALDKPALAEHIRETYEFPPQIELKLGEPKPSQVYGFDELQLTMEAGGRAQSETVYLSRNGRFYMLGAFKDLQTHPDQERLAKMKLESSAFRGRAEAPVQVVEYTDFECPYCQRGYLIMRDRIMQKYPEQVRWVYKSLPLTQIHPWAKPAAIAVECAKKQGNAKFWSLHDALFDKQEEINGANFEEKLAEFLPAARIEKQAFDACYDKKETEAFVDGDADEARTLGISGTPAFVVNGHLVPGANGAVIEQLVDEALAGKHGKI